MPRNRREPIPHTLQVTLLVCRTDFRMQKIEKQRFPTATNTRLPAARLHGLVAIQPLFAVAKIVKRVLDAATPIAPSGPASVHTTSSFHPAEAFVSWYAAP